METSVNFMEDYQTFYMVQEKCKDTKGVFRSSKFKRQYKYNGWERPYKQTMICNTQCEKLKIEQHETAVRPGVPGVLTVRVPLVTPVVLL